MSLVPIARQFAQFACAPQDVPECVERQADRAMLDTLGAIIAGGAHEVVRKLAAATPSHSGNAVLATGGTADMDVAALINGMAAHVWDIDDTSYTGIMHGSAVIYPAILAVAQETSTKLEDARRAFIVGSEIAYVLAETCTHEHYFRGWWSTVTFGLIGATAAVGVLFELNEKEMINALGVAASASGGGKAVLGTDAKPYLVGDAARRAILFARAAKAGVTGPENVFEDDRGFLRLLNGGKSDTAALDSLGQRWRLVEPGLLFKTSPVCSAAHAAIDQMNVLMHELDAMPDQIARVHAEVPELVFISLVYPNPQTPQQAQFSLQFALACAANNGKVRFEDLSGDAILAAEKVAMMSKIHVECAPDLSTDEMRSSSPESARLTVVLNDGRRASGFCPMAKGMPQNPLSETELIRKFNKAIEFAGRSSVEIDMSKLDGGALFARLRE